MKTSLRLTLCLMLFMLNISSYAQNFVSNHSFESMYSCPIGPYWIDSCVSWTSYGSTPDYFNVCGSANVQVPSNFMGYQPAFDGNGYVGAITYFSNVVDGREYIGTELLAPLVVGKKYFVSCYVCRGNYYNHNAATNKMGFRFFNQPHSANFPCSTDNFAHVFSTTIVTDSVNWTKIEGSFIADSAYRYLAIGNFFDDQNTDTVDLDDPFTFANLADYYIDYVCLTEDSLDNCDIALSTNNIQNKKVDLVFYVDHNSGILSIVTSYQNCSLDIFNIEGKCVSKLEFSNVFNLNLEYLKTGIYFARIINSEGNYWTNKFLKSQ